MLSVTNDCLLSWLRCAELLQVWCNEVLKTSSRCAELLLGTDGALVTDRVKTLNQSLCDLAQQEIYMFKSMISTELSHIISDQTQKDHDLRKCSDVEVITHCVNAFVTTQHRFFRSAVGHLSHFNGSQDGTDASVHTLGSCSQLSGQAMMTSSGDQNHALVKCVASRMPGVNVSSTQRSPHSAGRCATDGDLNAVIKMLSHLSSPASNTLTSSVMSSKPDHSHKNLFNSIPSSNIIPVHASQNNYDLHKNIAVDQHSMSNGHYPFRSSISMLDQFRMSESKAGTWTQADTMPTGTTLDQFRASEFKAGTWTQADTRSTAPPAVFVEEAWPILGTEVWSQYAGWSPVKTCESTTSKVMTIVDSCSSDESPNREDAQQPPGTGAFMRRRHSSSEQPTMPDIVVIDQSEQKPSWGLTVPPPGLTVEGHRQLFMQRSDPLAQRPFSCWQTGGISAGHQPADYSSLFSTSAGNNGVQLHHRMTTDRTF